MIIDTFISMHFVPYVKYNATNHQYKVMTNSVEIVWHINMRKQAQNSKQIPLTNVR